MSFSLFGPSPFSEKCGCRRHDAFQQWLQRHLYHCPTRSDVNAVAYAADMPREREREGVGGWAPFCEAGDGGNAFPEVPPRPSIVRVAPDERSPSWPAWKWSNAHERRASVIFLTFPVPLLFLSSFSFGRKSQINGSDDGLHVEVFNMELQILIFQNPAWEIYN